MQRSSFIWTQANTAAGSIARSVKDSKSFFIRSIPVYGHCHTQSHLHISRPCSQLRSKCHCSLVLVLRLFLPRQCCFYCRDCVDCADDFISSPCKCNHSVTQAGGDGASRRFEGKAGEYVGSVTVTIEGSTNTCV